MMGSKKLAVAYYAAVLFFSVTAFAFAAVTWLAIRDVSEAARVRLDASCYVSCLDVGLDGGEWDVERHGCVCKARVRVR